MLTERNFNVNLIFLPPVLVCAKTKLHVCGVVHADIHVKELCKHC